MGTTRFCTLLFVIALLAPLSGADVPMPEEYKAVRELIDEGLREGWAPSVALAVVKEERVVWAEGFGFADVERKTRSTSDSIYLLASVSKPITATGVMVLADKGLIDLDSPANDYLPGAKLRVRGGSSSGDAAGMTLRRLANHTAGLPVHYNFYHAGSEPLGWDEVVRRYGFAAWAPGTRWEYSNLAFGLLGHITEVAAKQPWRDFLEHEVFDPLGMTRTSDRVRPGKEVEATAQYGADAAGRFVRVEPYAFDHPGASAIWSSAGDLARFALCHLNGGALDGARVLKEETARSMQRLSSERRPGSGTGIGWAVDTYLGQECAYHTGGMPGVSTELRLYPAAGAATVVLTNSHDRRLAPAVTRRLAKVIFGGGAKDESPQAPAAGGATEPSGGLAGTWEGKLEHFDGDVRLRLRAGRDGSVEVALGRRPFQALRNPRQSSTEVHGFITAPLRTQRGFHGVPELAFHLERQGERMTGICVAQAEGYFALSHWVELERKGEAEGDAGKRFDVLIRGGRIIDGTGAPAFHADLAISDGRIAAIGRLAGATASRVLDAAGLVVAPGFIDMMGQTAAPFLKDPNAGLNLLAQGITTINCGEGDSDAPLGEEEGKKAGWRTMRELFARLEKAGLPLNVVQTVGHTQVRSIVLGLGDRRASTEELARMKDLVREAMEAGAIGLSTALIYPPAIYAPEEEIRELAAVAGEYGGRYFTHMRNEGDRLLEAIDEALRIGKGAGVPVHIFHLKTAGQGNWGKMRPALERIHAARREGQDVGVDVYPYVNNGLGIRAFLHPRHSANGPDELLRKLADPQARAEMRREMEETGDWENWFAHAGRDWGRVVLGRIEHPEHASQNGKSLKAIADSTGKDPWDVFFAICTRGAFAMPETMSEDNKVLAMKEPFTSFDTDVGPAEGSTIASHPRAYGAFPRVLARYVRELKALSIEEAVHRMTAVAANEVFAYDRGRLSPGLAADVTIFDPAVVADRATFAEPQKPPVGVRWVLVNGAVVFEDGKYTGAKPGKVLRGPGYR